MSRRSRRLLGLTSPSQPFPVKNEADEDDLNLYKTTPKLKRKFPEQLGNLTNAESTKEVKWFPTFILGISISEAPSSLDFVFPSPAWYCCCTTPHTHHSQIIQRNPRFAHPYCCKSSVPSIAMNNVLTPLIRKLPTELRYMIYQLVVVDRLVIEGYEKEGCW